MIKVNNINGIPESTPTNYVAKHNDGAFFYFFETKDEWEEFFSSLPKVWSKEAYLFEIETAVDNLVKNQLTDLWYASLGDLAATALNSKARWNEEAILVNEWQSKCYELFEDYKLSVTEQTALSTETFINSLPKFNH